MVKFFAAFLSLFLLCQTARADAGVNIFAYSRPVPQTKLYDAYGRAVNLQDFAGDFLIVVFWSKKCIPCVRELDNLNRFVDRTKNDGIKVILISPAEEWENEEEQKMFLAKYGASDLDFYVDRGSDLAAEFGIFTSPHTVLINDKAMEIGRIRGAMEWDNDEIVEQIYSIKAQNS